MPCTPCRGVSRAEVRGGVHQNDRETRRAAEGVGVREHVLLPVGCGGGGGGGLGGLPRENFNNKTVNGDFWKHLQE